MAALTLPTAPVVCRHPLIHPCPARGSSMAPITTQVAELVQPYLTSGDLRSLQNVGPWYHERMGSRQVWGFLGFWFRVLGFRFRVFGV